MRTKINIQQVHINDPHKYLYMGVTSRDQYLISFLTHGANGVTPKYWREYVTPVVDALGWDVTISTFDDKTTELQNSQLKDQEPPCTSKLERENEELRNMLIRTTGCLGLLISGANKDGLAYKATYTEAKTLLGKNS
jgi:hypothetical protein